MPHLVILPLLLLTISIPIHSNPHTDVHSSTEYSYCHLLLLRSTLPFTRADSYCNRTPLVSGLNPADSLNLASTVSPLSRLFSGFVLCLLFNLLFTFPWNFLRSFLSNRGIAKENDKRNDRKE